MEMAAGYFKAHCLKLMDEVQKFHREIIITKHGKPVARLAPTVSSKAPRLLGYMKGQVQIKGDIVSPIKVRWTYDADNV